jgi:hypothetical protein
MSHAAPVVLGQPLSGEHTEKAPVSFVPIEQQSRNARVENPPSSSGGTLNDATDDHTHDDYNEKAFPAAQIGMKRSAHSSMDHVADLGTHQRVSVRRGKEEFAALERRFSNLSQRSGDLQRVGTRRSTRSGFAQPERVLSASSVGQQDVEKQDAQEEFNLAETLKSSKGRNDEAGIKHKEVGVAWEDLEVIGAGGLKVRCVLSYTRGELTPADQHPNIPIGYHGAVFNACAVCPRSIRLQTLCFQTTYYSPQELGCPTTR